MSEVIGTGMEETLNENVFSRSEEFKENKFNSWNIFQLDLDILLDNYLDENNLVNTEKRDELNSLIISYLQDGRNKSITDIIGIDRKGGTIFILYNNDTTPEEIDITAYIDAAYTRELSQIELEANTGKFELLLDAIDTVLVANEGESFYNGWQDLDENDNFEGAGDLNGENIKSLSAQARNQWKSMLENMSTLEWQTSDPVLASQVVDIQERYMRMSMGVGARNFRAIEVFRRSQEELIYMINSKLASLSYPNEVISYYLEMQTELAEYRGETSNTSGIKVQTIFIKTLQKLSYERLQSLNASMSDYTTFAQIMTGREEEARIIPHIGENERETIDLKGRSLSKVGQDIQQLLHYKFLNVQGTILSGEEVLQSIPQYNTTLFQKNSIDDLSIEEISLLSIFLKLERRFINIQSQIQVFPVSQFQRDFQAIAFGEISVHDDFTDSEYATEILSERLGKEGGLFDTLEKRNIFSIEDPLVGERTPENIIQSVSSFISEVVGDENGEAINGLDIISRIPGYTDIVNVQQEKYTTLNMEQKIFISSLAQLERGLKIEKIRLLIGDIRYSNNPNPERITNDQFSIVYQNAVISGGNAIQRAIDSNFDGESSLTREKLNELGIFDSETLDLLDLYNDIKGNGPWYNFSDTTESWMKVGLNIGKTIVGGIVLTMLTGGVATILGMGVRSVRLLELGSTLRTSGTRLQMIDMGVNASVASWWIYPEGHDSLGEMLTNRGSDMLVGGFTAWLGYGLTKRFTQEGAKLLSRGSAINTGVQAGDITVNGLAAEMGRQIAIQAVFTDKDLLDEIGLISKTEDSLNSEAVITESTSQGNS